MGAREQRDRRHLLTPIDGDGVRVSEQWDGDPNHLRSQLEEAIENGDRVFIFTMRREPDGGLQVSATAMQRKGPFTRVTWTEAYGTLMAWLDAWAGRSH